MFHTEMTLVFSHDITFGPGPVETCVCTFSSSEHGGGQFTLLRLYVAESEPARVAVGHHRNHMVRPGQVTGGGCGLQDRQSEHRGKALLDPERLKGSDRSHPRIISRR